MRQRFLSIQYRSGAYRASLVGGLSILMGVVLALGVGVPRVRAAQAPKQGSPAGLAPSANQSAGESAGDVARGKAVFEKNRCYECHGYLGQGGTPAGPRIGPDPIPWQAIAAYIRKPAGEMPPFSSKLVPDKDVQDIYAYLKSVPPPADPSRIPTFTKQGR